MPEDASAIGSDPSILRSPAARDVESHERASRSEPPDVVSFPQISDRKSDSGSLLKSQPREKFHSIERGDDKRADNDRARHPTTVLNMTVAAILLAGGSWVTIFLSFCLLSLLLVLLVQRGRFLYALRKVPYPTALPVIGNAYQLNCTQEGKSTFSRSRRVKNSVKTSNLSRWPPITSRFSCT